MLLNGTCASCEGILYDNKTLNEMWGLPIEPISLFLSYVLGVFTVHMAINVFWYNPVVNVYRDTTTKSLLRHIFVVYLILTLLISSAMCLHFKLDVIYEKLLKFFVMFLTHIAFIVYIKWTRSETEHIRIRMSSCIAVLITLPLCASEIQSYEKTPITVICILLYNLLMFWAIVEGEQFCGRPTAQLHRDTLDFSTQLGLATLLSGITELVCVNYHWLGLLPVRCYWYYSIVMFVHCLMNYTMAYYYNQMSIAWEITIILGWVPVVRVTKTR